VASRRDAAGVGSGGEVGRGAGREGRKSDIGGTQGPRGKTSRMTTDALCTPTAVGGVWVSGCLYPGRAPTTNSPKCSDPFLPTRHRYLLRFRQYSDLKQMDLHIEGPVREALVLGALARPRPLLLRAFPRPA